MIATGGLILLAGVWLIVTGLLARGQLQSVRTEVHQLRAQLTSGDLTGARTTLAALQTHAQRAHGLTTGPVWALAAQLPSGGEPIKTVRGITSSADELASKALPTLIDVRAKLEPGKLRSADGRIDLAAISAVRPALDRADSVMQTETARIGALPESTWVSPVDRARTDLLTQLRGLAGEVRSADLAVHIAPPMLGASGTKRYFVGFQNEAEARGTGGLPGAFGILEVTNGKLHFTRFENDSYLGTRPTGLNFGADYQQLYQGDGTTSLYVNSNVSPNFPYVGKIWATMWQKASGQRVDGTIALDPTALSYLLAVTGPAKLPAGEQVDAGNVVALTQSTAYARFGRNVAGRKEYLLTIAKAASTQIVDAHGSNSELLKAGGKAVGERRLLVWSADPAVQADLAQTAAAGIVPDTTQPYAGPVVINAAGNKLDYYLERSFTWQRTGCGSLRKVTATVTLTNTAPATGLTPYVTNRGDQHPDGVRPGDNRVDLEYFATRGALMDSMTVDGKPGTVGSGVERGHPVLIADIELPRGATRTIVFHLTEPEGKGSPQVLRQPLVRPMNVTIDDAKCN
ncbi:MAG: hypothetical protein QOC66_3443 [Pseudonocardiales bacterium]|nr:hypothetical protein [Pseudonocardiales bacterium]